jgi:hypothetical protein
MARHLQRRYPMLRNTSLVIEASRFKDNCFLSCSFKQSWSDLFRCQAPGFAGCLARLIAALPEAASRTAHLGGTVATIVFFDSGAKVCARGGWRVAQASGLCAEFHRRGRLCYATEIDAADSKRYFSA